MMAKAKWPRRLRKPPCPYWHDVMADWLWLFPMGGYCAVRPDGKVRIPGYRTFEERCAAGRPGMCVRLGR